ncbi:MAG TPA: biopolymer transporter TolR, partial [Rhodothermales bacterium]|nr:biopolymer transporter TolR [Rhodothermales bacterium]
MQKPSHRLHTALLGLALLLPFTPASAQQLPLVLFEAQSDVGAVKHPGSAAYDEATQSYTITSSGGGQLHLVWHQMSGDFILRTNAAFTDGEGDPHRKLGWTIRTSLDSSSAYVDAAVHGNGLTSLQFRRTPGGAAEEQQATVTGADVIQLARSGNTYTMSVARNGDTFESRQVSDIDLGDTVYVGLFVSAHDPDAIETAHFHNVRIVIPPWEGFTPYRDYLGSNLELLDVATGDREIIFRHPASIQAPNWTPDGKSLIYNGDGLLYRFDLDSGIPSQIFSGRARRINNDHVLTSDGTMLGISNSDPDRGNVSLVYTMPVDGGIPKLIVPTGPSYLHGWSPDNKYLAFVGRRNGDFDIYRVPAAGGPEERLTTTPGLDDGPEYSPDG